MPTRSQRSTNAPPLPPPPSPQVPTRRCLTDADEEEQGIKGAGAPDEADVVEAELNTSIASHPSRITSKDDDELTAAVQLLADRDRDIAVLLLSWSLFFFFQRVYRC